MGKHRSRKIRNWRNLSKTLRYEEAKEASRKRQLEESLKKGLEAMSKLAEKKEKHDQKIKRTSASLRQLRETQKVAKKSGIKKPKLHLNFDFKRTLIVTLHLK
jgi:hypothetical protein